MEPIDWLRNFQPDQPTVFARLENEYILSFKNKSAYGILGEVIAADLKKSDERNVVFIIPEDEYRLAYSCLLSVLKKTLTKFESGMSEKLGDVDEQKSRMRAIFLETIDKEVKSERRLDQLYHQANDIFVKYLDYNLETFAEGVFSRENLPPYQISRLSFLANALRDDIKGNDKRKRLLAESLAKALFKEAADKACNIREFHNVYYKHVKEHQPLMPYKSYEFAKGMADVKGVKLTIDFYKNEAKPIHHKPNRTDAAQMWSAAINVHLEESSLIFDDLNHALFNIALIVDAQKKDKYVPGELNLTGADLQNVKQCIKKLQGHGERVKNNGLLFNEISAFRNGNRKDTVTIKRYVDETSGIVASYKTFYEKDTETEVEKLILVHWIKSTSVLIAIQLDTRNVINKFYELQKYCEDFAHGFKMPKLRGWEDLHQQILNTLKCKRSKLRDTATVVHHIFSHGDADLYTPLYAVTEERLRRTAEAYISKVRRTARRLTIADIRGKLTQFGNYHITLKPKVTGQNIFGEMHFTISPTRHLMLLSAM